MSQKETKKTAGKAAESNGKGANKSTASTGKKTNSGQSGKSTTTKSKAQKAGSKSETEIQTTETLHWALRLAVGAILLLFGFFLLLSLLGVHAWFLDVLRALFSGLFGYGFYITPFAFFMISWVILRKWGRLSPWRISAIVLDIVVVGSFFHAIIEPITCPDDISLLSRLWSTGKALHSGGVISGCLGHVLVLAVSKFGAIFCLFLLLVCCTMLSFQAPVRKLIHDLSVRKRDKIEEARKSLPNQPEEETMSLSQSFEILSTPIPRAPRAQNRRKQERSFRNNTTAEDRAKFDVSLDDEAEHVVPKKETKTTSNNEAQKSAKPLPDDFDEDLPFKKKKATSTPQKRACTHRKARFNIPMDDPYTQQVQQMVRQDALRNSLQQAAQSSDKTIVVNDPFAPFDNASVVSSGADMATVEEVPIIADTEKPQESTKRGLSSHEMLTDEEIHSGIKSAEDSGKVSKIDANDEEANIARQIEATEAEAETAPEYHFPPMQILTEAQSNQADNTIEMQENVVRLQDTLSSFGVDIKVDSVIRGPSVTRYEMALKPGTKMSKITSLNDDIALSLGVSSVRVAAVTGKNSTIGIEVPNRTSTSVPIRSVMDSKEFRNAKSNLAFAVGKDISGSIIIGDVAKMPHLLIAGTTGSGKSVCMNSIIVSLLYRTTPEQCRMIMIDPKVVELSVYNGIPHLLIPVVTDAKKAAGALQWAVTEMERRYSLLAECNVRDLAGYNKQASNRDDLPTLPQIVVIIDELADLMLVAAKEVENSIIRIAQKARAAGMHLVIATQRPSTNVITGLMKANIPSRIAFAVSSSVDSRIILDTGGAEKLLGKGDMLFAPIGSGNPVRVQGCFITDEEVEAVVEQVKQTSEAEYDDSITQQINQSSVAASDTSEDNDQTMIANDLDELFAEAVEVVLDTKQASVSMLQRRLRLGYSRAARIVDEMEENGIVGPFEGSKPRQLLITREQWGTMTGLNPKASSASSVNETSASNDVEDDAPF